MFVHNLMGSGGPAILPTAIFVVVLAVALAGFFFIAILRWAFGLLAGSSSNRGSGGLGFVLIFFALAALGIYFLYQNATHLMS